MKTTLRLVLAALVVAVFGASGGASAGEPTLWHVGAGLSFPSGGLGDALDDGWAIHGGATLFPFKSPSLGVRIEGGVNFFDMSNEFLDEIDTDTISPGIQAPDDGDATSWHLAGNLLWQTQTRGPVDLYVTGGVGVYYLQADLSENGLVGGYWCDWWTGWCYPYVEEGEFEIRDESSWEYGFNVAAGVTFALKSGNELYLEAGYHLVQTDGDADYIPVTFGIRF